MTGCDASVSTLGLGSISQPGSSNSTGVIAGRRALGPASTESDVEAGTGGIGCGNAVVEPSRREEGTTGASTSAASRLAVTAAFKDRIPMARRHSQSSSCSAKARSATDARPLSSMNLSTKHGERPHSESAAVRSLIADEQPCVQPTATGIRDGHEAVSSIAMVATGIRDGHKVVSPITTAATGIRDEHKAAATPPGLELNKMDVWRALAGTTQPIFFFSNFFFKSVPRDKTLCQNNWVLPFG